MSSVTDERRPYPNSALKKFSHVMHSPFVKPILHKDIKKLVVFGDSYSDNGNIYKLSNYSFPPRVFYKGRFTNGKVWAEYLCDELGITLENKAQGGATVNNDLVQSNSPNNVVPQGIKQQVDEYVERYHLENRDPNEVNHTIYSILAAGNDYLFSNFAVEPKEVVENIGLAIEKLATEIGAKYFFILDAPEFSMLPYFNGLKPGPEYLKALADTHNTALDAFLTSFVKRHDVCVYRLLTSKVFSMFTTKENQKKLNIRNVSGSCVNIYYAHSNFSPTGYKTPDDFFFWDAIHPTTKIHLAIARISAGIIKKNVTRPEIEAHL